MSNKWDYTDNGAYLEERAKYHQLEMIRHKNPYQIYLK